MSVLDYSMMIEDSHIETVAHRIPAPPRPPRPGEGPLIGACLTDRLADGLSLVYSFYAPEKDKRSLGAYIILDHIAKARRLGLPHVYLGYRVEGSRKMAYKAAYLPQERLGYGSAGSGSTAVSGIYCAGSAPTVGVERRREVANVTLRERRARIVGDAKSVRGMGTLVANALRFRRGARRVVAADAAAN